MFGIDYLILYVFVVILFLWWKDSTFSNIPGPRGWPILGNVPKILRSIIRGDHLDGLIPLFEKFGNTFQVGLLGVKHIVHISDTEDLKFFFQSPNFVKGHDANENLHDIFGDGIFNTDGENWRVQRQTASSLFHFNNLQAFVPVFYDAAKVLNAILAKSAKSGQSTDLQKLFMRYTIDSIGKLGYGINIDALGENKVALDFANSFDYVQAATSYRFLLYPAWKWFPRPSFNRHISNVDLFMKNVVADRKREVSNGVDISDRHDLLSKFISVKNESGTGFSDKYLVDILKNFLIAGRDTTAISLTWTFYLLALHPDVEQKVLKEISEVIGNAEITHEHLKSLKYMKQVIDESLRLYPPVPMDERTPDATVTLPSGNIIPAGTLTVYSAYAIHRLPHYWKDPQKFNPDRWVTDDIKPYQFVPFHGGPRICLGQNMAYVEMKVLLSTVLPLFKFKLAKPDKVRYNMSLLLPTKYGLEVYVTPRKH